MPGGGAEGGGVSAMSSRLLSVGNGTGVVVGRVAEGQAPGVVEEFDGACVHPEPFGGLGRGAGRILGEAAVGMGQAPLQRVVPEPLPYPAAAARDVELGDVVVLGDGIVADEAH